MDYIEQYKQLKPIYELFSVRLKQLIESLLKSESINFHLIEGRAKEVNSFREKIIRKGTNYSNPLKEITDLCGLRIIVYYQKDIELIDKIINDNFEIDKEKSIDKRKILKNNEFGYLSNHYIVKINKERRKLPEWKEFKTLFAEIQLRTVLQHSWAAISHELEYKNKYDIPELLKRKLFRLAGLFELADEQFGEIKKNQIEINKAIENKTSINDREVYNEINLDTIRNFFESDDTITTKYFKIALDAGFEEISELDDEYYESDYSEIIKLLSYLKIDSLDRFIQLLTNNFKNAESFFKEQYRLFTRDVVLSDRWEINKSFIIYLFLMTFLNEEQLDSYNTSNWEMEILDRVKEGIYNWKNTTANKL